MLHGFWLQESSKFFQMQISSCVPKFVKERIQYLNLLNLFDHESLFMVGREELYSKKLILEVPV